MTLPMSPQRSNFLTGASLNPIMTLKCGNEWRAPTVVSWFSWYDTNAMISDKWRFSISVLWSSHASPRSPTAQLVCLCEALMVHSNCRIRWRFPIYNVPWLVSPCMCHCLAYLATISSHLRSPVLVRQTTKAHLSCSFFTFIPLKWRYQTQATKCYVRDRDYTHTW